MKGIILAGGVGTRLHPITLVASKQLQPVFDKPMIYYPLTTLIENGIREICIISTPQDIPRFRQLLGDGKALGIAIEYMEQVKPQGIAQAFIIAEDFIGNDSVVLILGDNVFYGGNSLQKAFKDFKDGATIFAYRVRDPERYGIVELDRKDRVVSIEEKPKSPKSNYAIPGLYIYDNSVIAISKSLKPSPRGELEITDVHRKYLLKRKISVIKLGQGFVWLDAGTPTSLHEASTYVHTIEKRHNIKIGCPEEAALRSRFISVKKLKSILDDMPNCEYRDYLFEIIDK
jgi:glucose-1-phosphate thymidylyltransferase